MSDEQLAYRRFNVGDGMVVVAALALFCANLSRSIIPGIETGIMAAFVGLQFEPASG